MLNNIGIYKIWAPNNTFWTDWAKPTAFINMEARIPDYFTIPNIDWISRPDGAAAIIVDLPGKDGVLEGLALARMGYRPVPLYNGVVCSDAYRMVVPALEIEKALYYGADELARLRIAPDAPPAFLIDSNRMTGHVMPGKYDNRWSVFPQDMPSASYLLGKGINSVVVRADTIQRDLEHVLYRYQSLGIAIYKTDGTNREHIVVSKPSRLGSLLYRLSVTLGLRRNPAGGFGGIIPESGGGG